MRAIAGTARWVRPALAAGVILAAAALIPGRAAVGAAAHTVEVTIVAGQTPAGGGFNFNGYGHGKMVITVPVGWKVAVEFENAAVLAHSLIVLPYTAAQPPAPKDNPAFPGAATKDISAGLAKGKSQTLTFTASKPGTYEIACGVPGHASAGMWDKLVVSSTAKAPSVTPAGAAKLVVK